MALVLGGKRDQFAREAVKVLPERDRLTEAFPDAEIVELDNLHAVGEGAGLAPPIVKLRAGFVPVSQWMQPSM